MYLIRLVSAFLFSCVALFFLYLGVWHFSVQRMEQLLPYKIEAILGQGVSYDSVEQRLNPLRMEMVLKNVRIEKEKDGGRYEHQVGDVLLEAEFWSFDGLQVTFPSRQHIVVSKGSASRGYELYLAGAQADFSFHEDILDSFSFTVGNYALLDEKSNKKNIKGEYFYSSCSREESGECGLTTSGFLLFGNQVDTLSVGWKNDAANKAYGALDLLVNVLTQSSPQAQSSYALDHLFKLHQNTAILNFYLEKDELWLSGNGDFSTDLNDSKGGDAKFSLTSNDQGRVLDYLLKRQFLNLYGVRKLRSLSLLIGGARTSYTVSYALGRDKIYINGDEAGQVKSLSHLLEGLYAY